MLSRSYAGTAVSRVYRSKVDILVAAPALGLPVLTVAAISLSGLDSPLLIGALVMLCALISFAAWLLVSTRYEIDDKALLVRSGPFLWRIAYGQITSMERTSDPRSGPALSLDRLRSRYAGSQILISPADQEGFIIVMHEHAPRARVVR